MRPFLQNLIRRLPKMRRRHLSILALMLLLGLTLLPGKAEARFCCPCCNCCGRGATQGYISNAFNDTRNNFLLGSLYSGTAINDLKKQVR